ncbi:MAG: hypothetical protein GXP18_04580 [Gammaproteobacteria bacterium]|nr:hypothetical protein [Gammaproteobacteria bacterium]
MTLSHAIEETPTIIDNALNELNSVIQAKIQQAQNNERVKYHIDALF